MASLATLESGNDSASDQYDSCMVFRAENETFSETCKKVVGKLVNTGLEVKSYLSFQRDEVMVLIKCPNDKLAAFADLIDYKMYLEKSAVQKHAERGDESRLIPPIVIPHRPDITPREPYEYIYGKVTRIKNRSKNSFSFFARCSTTLTPPCKICTGVRQAQTIQSAYPFA